MYYRPLPPHDATPDKPRRNLPTGWDASDVVAATGLVIGVLTTIVLTAVLGVTIDDDESTGTVLAFMVLVGIAAVGVIALARKIGLQGPSVFMLMAVPAGLAIIISLASSDPETGGSGELIGIPSELLLLAVIDGAFLATAWFYFTRKLNLSIADLGFVLPTGFSPYLLAVGLWLLALVGASIWAALMAATDSDLLEPPDNAGDLLEISGGQVLMAWVLAGVIAPLVEEAFFRGFVLPGLLSKFSARWAVVLSAALFAVFHVDPRLYVPMFLLGAAFAVVYLRTRSIWPSVFVHSLQNTIAVIIAWQS